MKTPRIRVLARAMALLIALLAMSVAPLFAQATSERPADQFFDSDGVQIRYVEMGQGEPLLLMHGFAVNIEFQWGSHLKTLAEQYRVIAFDARGHGKSGKPHGDEHYGPEMAEDAIRLMDHLGIGKARVMGYSMGGALTLNLVANHPDRLVSAIIGGNGWAQPGGEMDQFVDTLVTGLESGEGIKPLIVALVPEGSEPPTEEQLNQINAMAMAANDPIALASVARGFRHFMVEREALAANQVPTAIIIGSVDPLRRLVAPTVETMANLQVVVLEGDDHGEAPRNPDYYMAALAFFDGKDPNAVLVAAKQPAATEAEAAPEAAITTLVTTAPESAGTAVATIGEGPAASTAGGTGAATAVAGTDGVNPALLSRW